MVAFHQTEQFVVSNSQYTHTFYRYGDDILSHYHENIKLHFFDYGLIFLPIKDIFEIRIVAQRQAFFQPSQRVNYYSSLGL